jgi:hypothetical protein
MVTQVMVGPDSDLGLRIIANARFEQNLIWKRELPSFASFDITFQLPVSLELMTECPSLR